MTHKAHECPNCRCTHITSAQTWADQHLIRTGKTTDHVPMGDAFSSYLTWFQAQQDNQFFYTQNKLTRALRAQGHRIDTISRGNHLIGYRLAP